VNPFVEEILEKTAAATGLEVGVLRELLSVPPDEGMGDYAIPCFTLAKTLRKSPVEIAREVAGEVAPLVVDGERIARVSAAGPYVNFSLNRRCFIEYVLGEVRSGGENYGSGDQGAGKTLVIDFSSPNLARPFSIAHLRSTAIGHAIYRIHRFLGWHCVGINHMGDYGANFGQLLAAYIKWADPEKVRANPVPELLALYIRFNEEKEANPDIQEEARVCLRRLADGDEEMVSLWRFFIDEGRAEAERIYDILDVHFDEFLGESFFADKLDDVVELFQKAGLAEESDGALIVRLDGDGEDLPAPCMLRTSNGTSTYHSRDIAALLHRHEKYGFDRMVYVTDMRQMLHFRQLFKALKLLGVDWIDSSSHAPFGMMSFKGEAMATRKGNIVFLEEVLDRAVELTTAIIDEKNPDLKDKQAVARQVGISAVIFADVSNRRTRDIIFDLKDVLNFDGETGPYIQYTHARFCSILRKHGRPVDPEADLSVLDQLAEMRVARKLSEFPRQLQSAAEESEPSYIASFLIDLATVANKFYNELPVLVGGDENLTAARIRLVDGVRTVMRTGLSLLGMNAPEEM
jgi:arginyl-tRNA synthetase